MLECSNAETGVGATIAPRSQLEKGHWAALVMPAKQSNAAGSSADRVSGMDQRLEIQVVCLPVKPENRQGETQAPGQIHHQRPPRVSPRLLRLRVADQQERAQGGDFPKEEQPGQIVREDQSEHRPHEHEQQREKQGPPVGNIPVRQGVVFAHVTHRVKTDAAAQQAVDQRHDHRKLVHEQMLRHA